MCVIEELRFPRASPQKAKGKKLFLTPEIPNITPTSPWTDVAGQRSHSSRWTLGKLTNLKVMSSVEFCCPASSPKLFNPQWQKTEESSKTLTFETKFGILLFVGLRWMVVSVILGISGVRDSQWIMSVMKMQCWIQPKLQCGGLFFAEVF